MIQGSLNQKIRLLCKKVRSVARVQTNRHTDTKVKTVLYFLVIYYSSNISNLIGADVNTSRDDEVRLLTSQMAILDKFRTAAFDNISTAYQGHKVFTLDSYISHIY